MTDLISRQAAINTAFTMRCRCDTNDIDDYANMMFAALEVLPAIEPKHGKWEQHIGIGNVALIKCSECGFIYPELLGVPMFNFCPNCGAKMDEVEDEHSD